MKLITRKIMSADRVRALCIKQDYFTNGDNEHYCNFLDVCNGYVSDNDILQRALVIAKYSDMDKMMRQYGCTENEALESICFNLIADACYTEVEIQE